MTIPWVKLLLIVCTGVANILFGRLYQRNWNRLNEDLNTFLRKAQMVFEENNKMLVVPAKLAHRLRLKLWRNFEDSLHHILMTCKLKTT